MNVIVGLGNLGRRYEGTRHNVGFAVVDELARRAGVDFRRSWRFGAWVAEIADPGEGKRLLVKPQTFMNRSGETVGPLLRRKGCGPEGLVVVVDDMDLDLGRLRVRKQGSPGGHNGLKSVSEAIGSDAYIRVRVGIGRDPERGREVDHVLTRFRPEERSVMDEAVRRAADAVEEILASGVDRAMNRFNEPPRP